MKIKTRDMVLTSLFTALMVVGAFVKIPFPLVPLTFQTFFCAFAGIILGSRLGALSQILYLVMGLIGLPVFAYGGGISYIYNPTFGYVIGFVGAAFVIGKITEKQRTLNFQKALISVLSGLIIINLIGVPYFYFIKNVYLSQNLSVWYVISAVFFPYFVKDLILYIIAAATASQVIPTLRRAGLKEI